MTFPTWDSEGQKAINSLPTWGKMFAGADNEIALKLKLASVLDFTKRQRLYLALQKRGYSWDTYRLQWQKRGGQSR